MKLSSLIFFGIFGVANGIEVDNDYVKYKGELIAAGLDRSYEPCEDFPRFAGSGLIQFIKAAFQKRKIQIAENILTQRSDSDPAPIKTIKDFYAQCEANKTLLNVDRNPGPGDTVDERNANYRILFDYYSKASFSDDDAFNDIYVKVISWTFKYGLSDFWMHFGHLVEYGPPPNMKDLKGTCYETITSATEQAKLCDTMAQRIFGISGFTPRFLNIYYPSTQQTDARRKLLAYFIDSMKDKKVAPYGSCAEMVRDVFPMYYKFMLLDYEFPPPKGQEEIDQTILEYMTAIVEDYEATYRWLNVSDAEKKRQIDYVRNRLKFEKFSHPIFAKDTFVKYFGNLDMTMPYRRRHQNNYWPLLKYNIENRMNMFWTPPLDAHTERMEVGDNTYIGFGWEALTFPFFATDFQPSLAFSNFVFAFQDEAVSQIIHDAYARLNARAVRKTRVSNSILNTFSDVQLYFINLAQTLLIQKAKYDDVTLFDDKDKIWKLFKCLRPFSNAFKCEPGTKYHQVEECRVLKGNIFPNYNLSYYGHDAVRRFFLK